MLVRILQFFGFTKAECSRHTYTPYEFGGVLYSTCSICGKEHPDSGKFLATGKPHAVVLKTKDHDDLVNLRRE